MVEVEKGILTVACRMFILVAVRFVYLLNQLVVPRLVYRCLVEYILIYAHLNMIGRLIECICYGYRIVKVFKGGNKRASTRSSLRTIQLYPRFL